MSDSSNMPKKPVTPPDSAKQTTAKGPHGGGTPYNQAAIGKGFMIQKPIAGHMQKNNVDDK